MAPCSSRVPCLTRAAKKLSRIWTISPRCFFTIGGIGPRRTGGDIFSNVNAGIVHPLFIELKHSWNSPDLVRTTADDSYRSIRSNPGELFKHVLCQICDNPRRIAELSTRS